MSQTKDKRLFVRLDGGLHQQAHQKAERTGVKLSEVIRRLLLKWLKGEVEAS